MGKRPTCCLKKRVKCEGYLKPSSYATSLTDLLKSSIFSFAALISFSCNIFPQVSCISIELAHQIKFDKFSYFDSEFLFELQPKAKLTDVLSQAAISAHGLLINKKVRDLISGLNIMQHRYYKCLVKDLKDVRHDYYWLHISDYSVLNKINYKESKFYLREGGFREGNIELDSFDDYKNKKGSLGILYTFHADNIVIAKDFDSSLDLFSIPIFTNKIIVSERLKDLTISEKITGILVDQYQQVSKK